MCGDVARMKALIIAYADDSEVDALMAKVTCKECGSNYCNAASGFRAGPLTAVLASVVSAVARTRTVSASAGRS